jgi:hypothetical protein
MKRKVKKYDVGGMTDEEGKKGIFGGPKSSMQDEDTRFKGQASNRRSGLPSFKESTGTSYGPGSDSPAVSVSKEKTTVTRSKPNIANEGKKYETYFNQPANRKLIDSDVIRRAEENKRRISDKPLETVSPESYLVGPGGGLKGLYGLAKNLVTRGAEKTAEKATQKLAADNARQILKDRTMAGTRAGQAAKEEADDLIRMGSDFMKKGGKVKQKMSYGGKVKKMASGGKSASARADGCAIRGKTRA